MGGHRGRRAGAQLVVLNVGEHLLPPPTGGVSVSGRFVPDSSQPTAEQFVTEIQEVLVDDPPVVVQPMVKQGSPAKVLIEQSANADPLVVGTRGPCRLSRPGAGFSQPARRRLRALLVTMVR